MNFLSNKNGLTLPQLIVVIAILVVLGTTVFVWIDPVAKIGETKDTKRKEDILLLVRAINDYANSHQGALPVLGNVTTTKQVLCREQTGDDVTCDGDTSPCLPIVDNDFYADYLGGLPIDPDKSANTDTGYFLKRATNNKLVVGACDSYSSTPVHVTSTISVSCDTYAGGHCWYLADTAGEDCDSVCADLNLECVDGATYGPDVDDQDVGYCGLNISTGTVCSSGCTETTSLPPANYDGASTCLYRNYPLNCSEKSASYLSICACY